MAPESGVYLFSFKSYEINSVAFSIKLKKRGVNRGLEEFRVARIKS